MKQKNKRLLVLTLSLILFATGSVIILTNLRDNLIFYSPSEVMEKKLNPIRQLDWVEMVQEESLQKKVINIDGRSLEEISFIVTDFNEEIKINYIGILPDLFKEGQGVVVEGIVENNGIFNAKYVLAKHDENYMPPEINDIESIKDRRNDI